MSPYLTNCNDLYTYDWHGNFQGVNSAVVDLTLCDDPLPIKKRIKKESVEQTLSDSITNNNMTPPTSDGLSTTKAPPTTVPAKRRRGRPRKVKISDDIPVQTGEVSVLDTDRNGSEVGPSSHQRKSTDFSSSDMEAVSESERLREHRGSKTKKATRTLSKSTVAAKIESSDTETRHRARQPAPSGGRKREKEEKRNRKRTASGGSVHDSDAETRHRTRQPSGDGRRREKEKEKRRERIASEESKNSDVHRDDHTRQPGKSGRSKTKNVERERTASGGSVCHKIDEASVIRAGMKAHTSSAGGKEKRRGVSRVLLSSEGESEGEGNIKSLQRAGKSFRSRSRQLCITESETGSYQSESETANERGQPTSVAARRQQQQVRVVINDPMDAYSPLLSPAKKSRWGGGAEGSKIKAHINLSELRENNTTQNELHNRKEHRPSKMCTVRPSDPMDAFSPLLSPPPKKKSMWGGGPEEREVRTSSAITGGTKEREASTFSTIAGALSQPKDDKMTQSQLRNLRQ